MALTVKQFNLVLHDLKCLSSESSGDEIDLISTTLGVEPVITELGNGESIASYASAADPLTVYSSGQNEIRAGRTITLEKKIGFSSSTEISLFERQTASEGAVIDFSHTLAAKLGTPTTDRTSLLKFSGAGSRPITPRFLGGTQIIGNDFANKGLSTLEFNSGGSHYQLSFEVQRV